MKSPVVLLSLVMLLTAWLGSGCVVTAPAPPPPPEPMVETYGVAPYPGAVWISGTWGWHPRERRYRWHRGHWR